MSKDFIVVGYGEAMNCEVLALDYKMGRHISICVNMLPHKTHSRLGKSVGHNRCLHRVPFIVSLFFSDFVFNVADNTTSTAKNQSLSLL